MADRYESEDVDVSPLGKPLLFEYSGKTAQNRFMKAAMTERISTWDPKNLEMRGIPTTKLINVYKRWGEGQYGVIVTGNIMIELDHLQAAGNPIIPRGCSFTGERMDAFRELATQAKKHGSLIIGQLSHPGRQVPAAIQSHPISASTIQLKGNILGMTFAKPHPATEEEIKNVIDGFAHAAEFLHKAGYDGAELHSAHGYLLAQFLSASTNKRTDRYGGSSENRSRLVLEVAQEIRRRVPDSFSLSIKLNSVEFQGDGFETSECKDLCAAIEANRFDFVELSGGNYEKIAFVHQRESTKKREAFFLEFAEAITPVLNKTRCYVTGGLKTAGAMVKALDSVDGIGLARSTCQEPDIPNTILKRKATGVIRPLIDQENFGLTSVVAGTLISQVGMDQQPLDLSQQALVDIFLKSLANWSARKAADTGGYMAGYVDLEGITPKPYGESYAEYKRQK